MRILKARYRNTGEFLAHLQSSFASGGIFYPTREPIPVGENVVVEVRFPELTDRQLLRGFVAWRRPARHRQKIRAGVGIEFLPTEKSKVDFLTQLAKGELERPVAPRRHRRLPVELGVSWRVKEERANFSSKLDDIGAGGAFIRTTESPTPGTPLVLEVLPPGAAVPLSIEGRVAWARQEPGSEGFGVEFRCRDTGGLRRLKELVRRLEGEVAALN
jgi:Tfp pilus assembly protein PilZ